jgi:hypothetical protein
VRCLDCLSSSYLCFIFDFFFFFSNSIQSC